MSWILGFSCKAFSFHLFRTSEALEMMRVRTLYVFVSLLVLSSAVAVAENVSSLCRKIRFQSPPMVCNSLSNSSSWLKDMILCRSGKLYFRTSVGLFAISSIDYSAKTLTVVPNGPGPKLCSESAAYISPTLLSAGFPPQQNSLILFNCRSQAPPASYRYQVKNCSRSCNHLNTREGQSCLVLDDIETIRNGFHPKDLNCSHFLSVHRSLSSKESGNEYNMGMKVSFEVDHKPDLCQECRRLDGKCGAGLKCFCHLAQCVDKIVARSTAIRDTKEKTISSIFSTGVLVGYLLQMI